MKQITIPAQYAAHLKFAASVCSTDTLRPAITGVLIQVTTAAISITGTDAHRLVSYTFEQSNGCECEVIIPAKYIRSAVKLKTDTVIAVDGEAVTVNSAPADRLIDAEYPNYPAVIPQDPPILFDVARGTLLRAVKGATFAGNCVTSEIKFEMVSDQPLKISAYDIDYSMECVFNLGAIWLPAGGALPFPSFKVNGNLLASLIAEYPEKPDYVRFAMVRANSALVIKSTDSNLTVLLMPIYTNEN